MFYKLDNGELLAGEIISAPSFMLLAEDKDTYSYPIGGWYWFDTESAAKSHFGLVE